MGFYENYRYGSSAWPTPRQIRRAGLYGKKGGKGIFLSLCPYTGKWLMFDKDGAITLIGGAASGKGTTILLYLNYYTGSMLINDPKGEIGAMINHYQSKVLGKDFFCINPTGLHTQSPWGLPQHRVNPFDILKADSPHLVLDCLRIATMLIPDDGGKGFFINRARQWMSNLLLAYALTSKDPNPSDFMEILNMIENNHADFKALALGLYATLGNDDITLTMNEIINKRCDTGTSGEYSGAMSTISTAMTFMADPNIKTLFSGADFSLDVLSQTNPAAVVDLAFPAENMGIQKSALRLIIGVAMLYQYRNISSRPLFVLDESPTLGKFEEMLTAYSYGRSFFQTFSAWQSFGQLSGLYGEDGMQEILSSSQALVLMGIRDLKGAKYASEICGNQTLEIENEIYTARAKHAKRAAINNLMFNGGDPTQIGLELGHWAKEEKHIDRMQRPLMTPSEILTMPEDKSLVVTSGLNLNPLLASRQPYFKNRKIRKDFLPNPYHV